MSEQGVLFAAPVVEEPAPHKIKNADRYIDFVDRFISKTYPGRTPQETKSAAFESAIALWLNDHRPPQDPNKCVHCGKGGNLDPVGVTRTAATLVHRECWRPWQIIRRRDASTALREMGISPMGIEGDY